MKKNKYKVLGVMSGTSLDGIDLAECHFTISDSGQWGFKLGKTTTLPYSDSWKTKLGAAIDFSQEEVRLLNDEYTRFLGSTIQRFIQDHGITGLDAVCSHGHTVIHRPHDGITLQIGNLPAIAPYCEQRVVCDFRVQDVAMGGQGAPLVPIGDRLLFADYDYCLNLGGFANVSSEIDTQRIAYDICPTNIVLNQLAEQLGHPYDDGGAIAASGDMDDELFKALNKLKYYRDKAPKSLGLEWVQDEIGPLIKHSKASIRDLLHTLTEHMAFQLAAVFKDGASVLVTGGGAYNSYLLQRIQHYKKVHLMVPDPTLIEYKEALIFGLLGVLRLRGEVNCLASVTGAAKDHSSGVVFQPD